MKFDKIPGIWFTLSAVAYVLGLVACTLLASYDFLVGFGAGGALVLVNALAATHKIKKTEFTIKAGVMASVMGGFYFRLALLAACLFALIKYMKVDPVGLVTGLSVVPVGLFVMLLMIYVANRRPEEV
jgi:MFS family permease